MSTQEALKDATLEIREVFTGSTIFPCHMPKNQTFFAKKKCWRKIFRSFSIKITFDCCDSCCDSCEKTVPVSRIGFDMNAFEENISGVVTKSARKKTKDKTQFVRT